MDEKPFPWTGTFESSIPRINETSAEPRAMIKNEAGYLVFLKKHFPYFILAILFLVVLVYHSTAKNEAPTQQEPLDALVLMIATPKGALIVPESLKLFPVNPKSLTKQQNFQLVSLDDLSKLKGRVRAKKNLAPNKPLFWSDLEFSAIAPPKIPTQIIFSKE